MTLDVKQLAEMVRRMRTLQKLYFRKSPKATVGDCKEAEREVDAAVAAILNAESPDLFQGAE